MNSCETSSLMFFTFDKLPTTIYFPKLIKALWIIRGLQDIFYGKNHFCVSQNDLSHAME